MDETGLEVPRANPRLVGQEKAEAELLEAFASGRCPHAWLLTGPRGVGKATLAFRFARHVLVEGLASDQEVGASLFGAALPAPAPASLALDPDHPVFRRVAHGAHSDLMVLERRIDEKKGKLKNDIPVADVREVGAFMSMTSGEGGWRVVIVDSADDMNRNAANALLKVLEEPPPRALLMLISHNPGRLLPTIRSRCRKLALRPLAPELIAAELGTAVPDTDRDRLGRLADGSLGRALDLAADSGLEIHSQLIELLASLPRLDGRALTAFCDRFSRVGTERAFDLLGELLLGLVNRIARSAAGAATAGVDEAESRLIAGLSARAPAETWLTYWEGVTHLLDRTRAVNLDRRHVLMTLMTRLARAAGAP